ncbi:MAG: type VI secretion system membrane subunit TssM [Pseudomonadales bacterium]
MKILRWFGNRWVLGVLGLTALGLVVWFLGPLFGFADARPLESTTARLVTILGLIIIWLCITLVKELRRKRSADAIVDGISQGDAALTKQSGAPSADQNILRERFEEALAVLKQARTKAGRKLNLYDMPWYVIVGPPGSGKTTALRNSGLHFPLADRFGDDALRGVGGTRNCDWWFTDDAVLLDTAGRYITQDSDADSDQAEWLGFLKLLKKYRKRQPINGVLLAISLSDLLGQSAAEREQHVRVIRQRIQELYTECGIRVPIYVMLTKADMLAGFVEFFEDLGERDREQVWGFTFDLDNTASTQDPIAQIGAELDLLIARLNDRVLHRVDSERDLLRRSAVYDFSAQLANAKASLVSFLEEVFRGSRFDEQPFVRGVYLTSGTQEGAPFDRLLGSVARNFGLNMEALPSYRGQGRSYFINQLLQDVVFQEAGLAGTNRKLERRTAWLQSALYAGLALALIGVITLWGISYVRNSIMVSEVDDYLATVETGLAELESGGDVLQTVVPALTSINASPLSEDAPWLMRMGLLQSPKIAAQTQRSYRRVLQQQLLPRLIQSLEAQLRSGESAEYHYEALKRYLMLDSAEHYDGEQVAAWFNKVWLQEHAHSASSEQAAQFQTHTQALFAEQPQPLPVALNEGLIETTRQKLLGMSLDERAYGQIKQLADADFPGFSIASAGGDQARLVFVRKSGAALTDALPALFSREGYQKVFLPASALAVPRVLEERWVLGESSSAPTIEPAALRQRIEDRYMGEFADQYDALLSDLTLAPFGNPSQATRMLSVLSAEESPFLMLIDALNAETDLSANSATDAIASAAAGTEAALQKAGQVQSQLSRLGAGRAARMLSGMTRVQQRFRGLRRLSPDSEGATSGSLERIHRLIKELYAVMSLVASEQSRGGVPLHVQDQTKAIVRQLDMEAANQEGFVGDMLGSMASQTTGITSGGVSTYINNEWNGQPGQFCQDAIAGRYPINKSATREIQLEDFARFFGPKGIMNTFFETYLKASVDTTRRPWRLKEGTPPGTVSDPQSLRQFERASAITSAFFRSGDRPSVRFELLPYEMDQQLTQFELNLNGQTLGYSFGPKSAELFAWPGEGPPEVRVRMEPPGASGRSVIVEGGPWGWFRILDRARLTPSSRPERFLFALDLDGRTMVLELQATSAYNPFNLAELGQFRCPRRI